MIAIGLYLLPLDGVSTTRSTALRWAVMAVAVRAHRRHRPRLPRQGAAPARTVPRRTRCAGDLRDVAVSPVQRRARVRRERTPRGDAAPSRYREGHGRTAGQWHEEGRMAVLMREAIGGSLRRARTEGRRTLREVSRRARVSLGYLSEVERGRKEASSELLAAICEALDDLAARRARRGRRGHRAVAGRRRRRGPPARTASDRAAAHGSAAWRARSRLLHRFMRRCPPRGPRCRCAAYAPPPEPRRVLGVAPTSASGSSPISSTSGGSPDRTGATMGFAAGDALGGRSRWPTVSRRPGST